MNLKTDTPLRVLDLDVAPPSKTTCYDCKWYKGIPQNVTQGMCFGNPPHVVMVQQQTPMGVSMMPGSARPVVNQNDESCRLYEAV